MTWRQTLRIYALEARTELLKVVRMPAYSLPTIAFPLLFYVLFGLSFKPPGGGAGQATYLLASYGVFGVLGASLFGFGVGYAVERGQGWMTLKQATPMPLTAYLLAKMLTAAAFGLVVVLSLLGLGIAFGGVQIDLPTAIRLVSIIVAGTLPFSALGLALGARLGPNSAPAIVNLIFLPMAFASGLWIPIKMLPSFFQNLAPAMPPYHLAQLALAQIGMDDGTSALGHLSFLALFTAVFLALAVFAMRRDEGLTYG